LVHLNSSSAVLVTESNKFMSNCNRFQAKLVDFGRKRSF